MSVSTARQQGEDRPGKALCIKPWAPSSSSGGRGPSSSGSEWQTATTGCICSSRTDSSLHRSEMCGTNLIKKSALKNPGSVQPRPCERNSALHRELEPVTSSCVCTHTHCSLFHTHTQGLLCPQIPRPTSRECYQLQLYSVCVVLCCVCVCVVNLQPQFREFRRKMCKLYRHVRAASRGGLGW